MPSALHLRAVFHHSSSFLLLCLQAEWSWASMQADRDSNTGSSVSKTKARKWSTGIRSRSKEPRAVKRRTRLHQKRASMHTCTRTHTHIHTDTHTDTHTHPKVDMRPSKATKANKQQLCNNNNNDITENKIHRVNHRPRYSYMISMLIFSDGKNVCPNELF